MNKWKCQHQFLGIEEIYYCRISIHICFFPSYTMRIHSVFCSVSPAPHLLQHKLAPFALWHEVDTRQMVNAKRHRAYEIKTFGGRNKVIYWQSLEFMGTLPIFQLFFTHTQNDKIAMVSALLTLSIKNLSRQIKQVGRQTDQSALNSILLVLLLKPLFL